MKNVVKSAAAILGIILILGACTPLDEESVNGNSQIQIRLTDAPADYDAVFIEVADILVNRSGSDSVSEDSWESLEGVSKGTYNLLELVNGHDTLLADANIPSGYLGQIRLVLGEGNWLEIDGKRHELKTPSGQQSGLKLQTNTDLTEGIVYSILLDFDVARSVVQAGESGQYILKPVIRVIEADPVGGIIRGVVAPDSVRFNTAVLAVMDDDTLSTYTDTLGNYMLEAVPPGSWSMHFMPDSSSSFAQLDTAGITVNEGEVSQVDVTLVTVL